MPPRDRAIQGQFPWYVINDQGRVVSRHITEEAARRKVDDPLGRRDLLVISQADFEAGRGKAATLTEARKRLGRG